MLLCAAFCLALSSSCTLGEAWHVDDAFTAEETTELQESATWLTEKTGAPPFVLLFDGDTTAERAIVREQPHTAVEADGSYKVEDFDVYTARRIYIRPGLTSERFAVVARHEFGHALGFHHHAEPGLMAIEGGQWSEADEDECRALGLCLLR